MGNFGIGRRLFLDREMGVWHGSRGVIYLSGTRLWGGFFNSIRGRDLYGSFVDYIGCVVGWTWKAVAVVLSGGGGTWGIVLVEG